MVVLGDGNVLATCRVLYIGSAVPLETASGIDAIQQPLRERYPIDEETTIEGIDTRLTVTDNDLQLLYLNQSDTVIQFPISSLTLCAAVKCVTTINGATGEKTPTFVSLNDPLAKSAGYDRPTIFTAISRRTQGLKVLECHGFICSSPSDALKLVKAASLAGNNLKKNGPTARSTISRPIHRGFTSLGETTQEARMSFRDSFRESYKEPTTLERTESVNRPYTNGIANGGPSMHLIPGEPVGVEIAAGPEFFEPVSTQGYFYSSDKTEVKKFNIAKLGGDPEPRPPPTETTTVIRTEPIHAEPIVEPQPPPRPVMNGGPPIFVGPRPPPPVFIRRGPPPPRPIFVGQPPPPPPVFVRPRFFSPQPPRFRPMPMPGPYMMPPPPPPGMPMPGPPPMYATPVVIRRRKPGSRSPSGSKSRSVTPTGLDEPQLPVQDENTAPKLIPNGDADTSSNSSHGRPRSPPTDYENRMKGQRMSRREEYEYRIRDRDRAPTRVRGMEPAPIYIAAERLPPSPYDYYVYPPRHGGYAPFTVYNPHVRSRSVPAHMRRRSPSPKKHGKKSKKVKKSKRHRDRRLYERQNKESDVSTDSFAGYHSEIPIRQSRREPTSGYEFYPPRDFRRDENQFMNERKFGRSIIEENRRESKPQPTAYELNNVHGDPLDGDFTLY